MSIRGRKEAVRAIVHPQSNQGGMRAGGERTAVLTLAVGGRMVERIPSETIPDIRRIAKAHGITRVRVFGCQVRGDVGSENNFRRVPSPSIEVARLGPAVTGRDPGWPRPPSAASTSRSTPAR